MSEARTREEWLHLRMDGLGASDAAPALGIEGAFRTQWQLFQEKRYGVTVEPDPRTAELMYWGTKHEPSIRERAAEMFGCDVFFQPFDIRRHPLIKFMHATPDGILFLNQSLRSTAELQGIELPWHDGDPGILECKHVSYWAARAWEDVRVPPHYEAQIRHLMCVLGCNWALMAALVAGDATRYVFLVRDRELEDYLIEGELTFWTMVVEGVEPTPDGSERTSQFLRKLYPQHTEARIQLPDEYLETDASRLVAIETIKQAEAVKRQCDSAIQDAMKEAGYADLSSGVSYSWKTRVSRKALLCPQCGHPISDEQQARYFLRHEPKRSKHE